MAIARTMDLDRFEFGTNFYGMSRREPNWGNKCKMTGLTKADRYNNNKCLGSGFWRDGTFGRLRVNSRKGARDEGPPSGPLTLRAGGGA